MKKGIFNIQFFDHPIGSNRNREDGTNGCRFQNFPSGLIKIDTFLLKGLRSKKARLNLKRSTEPSEGSNIL